VLSPYENIIIGNFLFGLGLAMGRRPEEVEGCVNLLQQTPLDKVLGDVMLQFRGTWRLIEFKRVGANVKKELVKLHTYIGATRRDADMKAASLRAHWYVETGPHVLPDEGEPEFKMMVRPYLEQQQHDGIPMEEFVAEVASDAVHGTVLQKDLDLYLRLIKLFGCLDGYQTSGLLVGVSSSGSISYLPLDNITDLKATCRLLRQRLRAREARQELQRGAFSAEIRRLQQRNRESLKEVAKVDYGIERVLER